jgi:glycosyltransferase involved in cell wall biosynthesis
LFEYLKSHKLLFILHYPPPTHGAALVGQYIKESRLINSSFNARYINLGTSTAVEEIGRGGIKKGWRYLKIVAQTSWQGITWRPDLVYITLSSHGAGLLKDSLVVAICRLLRLPHVFHFHNKGVKNNSKNSIAKRIYPFVFKKAKVILLSPLLYEDIAAYVPQTNVYYCANGIPDLSGSKNSTHAHTVENQNNIHLLFLSNLIESKGIMDLLKACKQLTTKGLDFRCTLAGGVGDLKEKDIVQFIEANNLQKFVSYVGKVSGEQKTKVLKDSDLFIFPTYYHNECFPLVLLEAMQFSLPIITTNEGAIPEMVMDNENGFIVPKNSPEAIAEKVAFYLNNREQFQQHGSNGRKRYEDHYTLTLFEDRMKEIINQITRKN